MRQIVPQSLQESYKKLEFVGEGYIYGKLYYLGGYPGAVLGGNSKVFGEVFFLLDEGCLVVFDDYEGYFPAEQENSLFVRKVTTAYLLDGGKLDCWVYEYNGDLENAKLIRSGSFKDYRSRVNLW